MGKGKEERLPKDRNKLWEMVDRLLVVLRYHINTQRLDPLWK